MINDQEAIKTALKYTQNIYDKASSFSIEEIIDSDTTWTVTISFRDLGDDFNSRVGLMGGMKKYKQITINKNSGSVLSMKMMSI